MLRSVFEELCRDPENQLTPGTIVDSSLLRWDGQDAAGRVLPSGTYIYRIRIGSQAASGKVQQAK